MNNEIFNILFVNDDGINSWGIKRLARDNDFVDKMNK